MIRAALALGLLATLVACGAATPPRADERRVCAADVQACPDGSYVSRNPARGCAFDRCPSAVK